jgi:hypothetical protein
LHLYSLPWVWLPHQYQAATLSSILYNVLQLYHQEGSEGGNVAARVEGRDQAATKQETWSGCRVSLTTRTRSSPKQSRSASSRNPWRRTRPGSLLRQHFLHYFSAEIPRGERGIRTSENTPSTHSVSKGVAVLNPRPPIFVFPLTRSGLCSRRPPCGSRILWQLPFGDPCQRALSCLVVLRSRARTALFARLVLLLPWLGEGACGPFR